MATLIEVIDKARNLLAEPLDSTRTFPDNTSTFFTDNILTTYHNLVQEEIQQELIQTYEDFFLTQTALNITDGCASYQLPSGLIKVRRVEDIRNQTNSDPIEIKPVTINNRDQNGFLLDSGSFRGGGYYLHGTQIILTSTPSFTDASAIQLHYIKKIPDVTAATATSEIPVEFHNVIVWGIVKYALFQQQGDTTIADREYEKLLAKMKRDAENRQVQRPRKVKDVYKDFDSSKGAF